MSAYSELIKNFERIRAYMREFYVYGFKSREEYGLNSPRSYDNERRRLESWLGEHMSFVRTKEGKSVFISIDSRASSHNPLYKAWKSKSFTDLDITLHFILLDILYHPDVSLTVQQMLGIIDSEYLSSFDEPMVFDESTLRKKLKEYAKEGIIVCEKRGRSTYYRRSDDTPLPEYPEYLDFYSEVAPCGVIGSFILDKAPPRESNITFKHHYITGALDSGVSATMFCAMRKHSSVKFLYHSRKSRSPAEREVVPLSVFISVQNGKENLIAFSPETGSFVSFRMDRISNVRILVPIPRFDELRKKLGEYRKKMWGVNVGKKRLCDEATEHVEFQIKVAPGEDYIVHRLYREKRVGTVEKTGKYTYRFSADVYDTTEMIPWIRTFICRITKMNFSNRTAENSFKSDIEKMYQTYGITSPGGTDSDALP